ncbi:hypothetical protein WJX72_008731 [[Myrmecia] bisecta]|uniref:Uncharacterized protein n=1 Tax=[Myrmecia] bisecta TaxID=41462 RepID=A0AAW1PE25_9CHLO
MQHSRLIGRPGAATQAAQDLLERPKSRASSSSALAVCCSPPIATPFSAMGGTENVGEYEVPPPNPVKKFARKLMPGTAAIDPADEAKEEHPHPKVEGYAAAGAHAVVDEFFMHLAQEHELAVLANVVIRGARAVAEFGVTEPSKQATRINAQEAFTGSYDAVERKWQEWYKTLPMSKFIFPLAAVYGGMLAVGLLMCVWRFALLGLGPAW